MKRTVQPSGPYVSEEIAKGVLHRKFHPGGIDGPHGETRRPVPGGQTWADMLALGGPDDSFRMVVPDIRMPSNQYWPLHWHDCWTVVLVVEGTCCVGDWWMETGDVFVTIPSLEYGPLVIGPNGCRLFEIFANGNMSRGGYSPEYRDHPTLQGGNHNFEERSALNKRNDGRQTLSLDGVEGMWKSKLEPGRVWQLGDEGDPERGIMKDTRLAPGEKIPGYTSSGWNAAIVLDGSIEIAGRTLDQDSILIAQPGGEVGEVVAGRDGAHLLDLARTASGAAERLLS